MKNFVPNNGIVTLKVSFLGTTNVMKTKELEAFVVISFVAVNFESVQVGIFSDNGCFF